MRMNVFAGIRKKVFAVNSENRVLTSSSKGNQGKWFKDKFWIKSDFLGYEGLAEHVCSLLAKCSNIFGYVTYNLCAILEGNALRTGCYSESFLSDDEEFLSISDLLDLLGWDSNLELGGNWAEYNVKRLFEIISPHVGSEFLSSMGQIILFDAIVLGEDRHYNNLGFISKGNMYRLAPLFDNGLSLLSDTKEYQNSDEFTINLVRSKPFSSDFQEQAQAVKRICRSELRIDLSEFREQLGAARKNMLLYYNEDTVTRITSLLFQRLEKTEGDLWRSL